MLTGISAFYGLGYLDIMAMPVGVRRRYFLDIPRYQAERSLQLAGVILLPHAGSEGQAVMHRWQVTARWIRHETASGIRQLRALLEKYGRAIKPVRGDDG